jgi:hypothetical protein
MSETNTEINIHGNAGAGDGGPRGAQSTSHTLQGTLVFDYGLPAAGVTVRLYNIGFGGRETQLGKDIKADAQGGYSISSPAAAAPLNLQVRVLDSSGKEITISKTKFNASQSETLNLIVPSSVHPLASEFQRLSTDLAKHIGDIAKLSEAQEDSDRQGIAAAYREVPIGNTGRIEIPLACEQTGRHGSRRALTIVGKEGLGAKAIHSLGMAPAGSVQQPT